MCNETWAYHVIPETKVHSITWKCPLSPTPQVQWSAKKLALMVYWNAKGVLFNDFIVYYQTIYAIVYNKTQGRLKRIVH